MSLRNDVLPVKSGSQVPGPAPSGGGKLKVAGWQSSRILIVGVLSAASTTAAITGTTPIKNRFTTLCIFSRLLFPHRYPEECVDSNLRQQTRSALILAR